MNAAAKKPVDEMTPVEEPAPEPAVAEPAAVRPDVEVSVPEAEPPAEEESGTADVSDETALEAAPMEEAASLNDAVFAEEAPGAVEVPAPVIEETSAVEESSVEEEPADEEPVAVDDPAAGEPAGTEDGAAEVPADDESPVVQELPDAEEPGGIDDFVSMEDIAALEEAVAVEIAAAQEEAAAEAEIVHSETQVVDEEKMALGVEEAADKEANAPAGYAVTEEAVENVAASALAMESEAPSAPATAAAVPEAAMQMFLGGESIAGDLQQAVEDHKRMEARVDALSAKMEHLSSKLDQLSTKHDMLMELVEDNASSAGTRTFLSKTFLTAATAAVACLAGFQAYNFYETLSLRQQANKAGAAVVQRVAELDRKLAVYDQNLAKALQPAPPVAHAPETPRQEDSPPAAAPLQERLNRLRNGATERKLVRRETGDWFMFNGKKAEECIADVEVIQALNKAYRQSGKPIVAGKPMPAHGALCVLKPDGKGGTEIVMTAQIIQ